MNSSKHTNNSRFKVLFFIITTILFTIGLVVAVYTDVANERADLDGLEQAQTTDATHQAAEEANNLEDESPIGEVIDIEPIEEVEEIKPNAEVLLAAVGDIMSHSPQIKSGLQSDGSYNFDRMFADVKSLLTETDVTIANFETTLGGADLGYKGYPQFNAPDELADAVKGAGVDILTTANNHSLDTWASGLKRTAKVLKEKGFKIVGTYEEKPTSRVLLHEVNDITFAILSYTESTNGLGDQYEADELNAMINLMTKENIERDVKEAQQLDEVDFIITLMHWGDEYVREPNEKQVEYAEFMAELGVDLILGSHPHVIQPTDTIRTENKDTFVVYSMGNFVSNQRVETLGQNFARTEDGVIMYFQIEKDYALGETSITNVDYVPTWVYKIIDSGTNRPVYRILPIEQFLTSGEISSSFKTRMERSYEATMSQMEAD